MARINIGEAMKARAFVKYGAIALMLGATGFVSGIGILTLVFAPKTGTFAPVNGSDAAAWIQAVGSIGAIIGAFLLGTKQSNDARKLALDLELQRRLEQMERHRSTVGVVMAAAQVLVRVVSELDYDRFQRRWRRFIHHDVRTALTAFDAIPFHEFGSEKRIINAVALRSALQGLVDDIQVVMRARGLQQAQFAHLKNALLPDHQETIKDACEALSAEWPAKK